MSVERPRLAAAQRTAVAPRATGTRRRWTRLASWLVIVPTLAFFSFSVVAGARTFGKPDYAQAAKQLPRDKQLVLLKSSDKEMCSVSQSQLDSISAQYTVGRTTIMVDGEPVDVVTVTGANDHDLRALLGDSELKCKLVRTKSVFYLPFNADIS